jgi:hypothetical protein
MRKEGSMKPADVSLDSRNRAEVVDEVSEWGVGLGILGVALFPLSIPIVVLTAATVVLLALPLLVLALLALPLVVAWHLLADEREEQR